MAPLPTPRQALSSVTNSIFSALCNAGRLLARHPLVSISAGIAGALFPLAVRDYLTYRTLGKGGYKYPIFGWLASLILKPFVCETTSVAIYDTDENKDAWLKADDLPSRVKPRPKTGWHVIPHRQIEQYPDEKIHELLAGEFETIAESNPELVSVGHSPHENFGDALLVNNKVPSPHSVAEASWREIGHIHTQKDHSLHVTLAPQDCKLVIEKGWGERHPLSGVIVLPKEYLMIYAPLTEEEVRAVGRILRASVGYMTGSKVVH
ncbi:hypothetical protein ACEPAI_6721 [Sanghuangporus weigelae]